MAKDSYVPPSIWDRSESRNGGYTLDDRFYTSSEALDHLVACGFSPKDANLYCEQLHQEYQRLLGQWKRNPHEN